MQSLSTILEILLLHKVVDYIPQVQSKFLHHHEF